MNLHGVAGPIIAAVNPMIPATVKYSDGYVIDTDRSQIPKYVTVENVLVQVQALTAKDLQHLDSLNIQGIMRALYLNGNALGVARLLGKGGDLFTFKNQNWLVTTVLETWETGWCKVAVTLQDS
ncbi:MAG: hypothetical protein VB141_10920 [Burkholderia gladioli]